MESSLAHIIMGEASICGFWGMLAVAHVYQRNQAFYGWESPNDLAEFLARYWWLFPDPTGGARYLVSKQDLNQAAVQEFTVNRGPPLAIFPCAGGLALYAFA